MAEPQYRGLLLIGDPHLEGRAPGFRKDDYAQVILEKLAWCLDYAREHALLPAILGDLFDKPRDNPNWLICRLMQLLHGEILGLYGNHDVHYNPELTADDSLNLLVLAGRLRIVCATDPWQGVMGGRNVVIGGSSYRQPLPDQWPTSNEANGLPSGTDLQPAARSLQPPPLVIWLTHHDILIPGYDEGRIKPSEIPGVDLVVNGHIHRRLESITSGRTAWITPGNISRRARSDASRAHVPSALRIDVLPDSHTLTHIEIPHQPFDQIFHEAVLDGPATVQGSAFVDGLAELQARRTAGGAGLLEFLNRNLDEYEPAVGQEILRLATEVTQHGEK